MLSALISEVYDAALDPSLWQGVLEKASAYVGGSGAAIYSKDSVSKTADITHGVGIDYKFQRNYIDNYVRIDPSTPGFFFFDIGDVVTTADILPYDEFLDSRFYKEWARPQGLVDMATSVLEKATTSYAVFTVFRHERDGLSDGPMRQRMKLLVPHVRRAALISKTIQLNRAEAATLADTLDSLAAGLFLMGQKGRLVQANKAGHAILSDGSILRTAGGRLIAIDPIADAAMRAAFAGIDAGDAGLGTQGIAVPLVAADGQHYVAHILPLTSGARRRTGAGYSAVAAVFVSRTQIEAPALPQVIAELYGLTPSELRVLLAVFETGGVSDTAGVLGISEATTKTHLHRLFAKTNTKRQADLVRLVAGFTGPLVTSGSSTPKKPVPSKNNRSVDAGPS